MDNLKMTEEQFEKFKTFIISESKKEMNKIMDEEIKAQPDKTDFFNNLRNDPFANQLFARGFIEGAIWSRIHKNTNFGF